MTPDPRGPVRTIISIEKRPDATLLTKSCGHVGQHNTTFTYKVGNTSRCYECGQEGIHK